MSGLTQNSSEVTGRFSLDFSGNWVMFTTFPLTDMPAKEKCGHTGKVV